MFTEAYERAERVDDHGLRASLGDQLVVRQQLAAELAGVPEDELGRFEERANRQIELAYFGGITVALIYADRSDRQIEERLAQMQEWRT